MARDPAGQPKRNPKPPSRREILKGLALTSLASSSTAAMTGAAEADTATAGSGTPEYRETDYVRRFYELARR